MNTLLALLALYAPQDTVKVKNVGITPQVLAAFEWGYAMVTERANFEAGWCLYGTVADGTAVVRRAEYPIVQTAGPHSILFGCRDDKDYLGRAHSHNSAYKENLPCEHSDIDKLVSFSQDPKTLVSIVVCKDTLDARVRKYDK